MADLRISELPPLVAADLEGNDDLPITDYSASETRRLTAKNLVQQGVNRLIDDGSIPGGKVEANSIGASQLGPGSVTESALVDGAVTEDKIGSGAVTTDKYGAASINAAAMGPASVGTTALIDGSVTADKLATASLDGGSLQPGTVGRAALAKPSVSTTELFDGAVDTNKLAGNAVAAGNIQAGAVGTVALADSSISTAKYQAGSVTGPAIADGTLQSNHYKAGSVNNTALANNSVTNGKIAPNTIVDADIQVGTIQADKIASVDGGTINNGTVGPAKLSDVTDRGLDQISGAIGHTNQIIGGTKFGLTYDENGHIVLVGDQLAPTDLPPATQTNLGAVSVPDTSGLTVTTQGALGHANTVVSTTVNGISWDANGHVTGGVALQPGEIPIATPTTVGGVSVPVGEGINVDGAGALRHTASGIAAGSYTKVAVNATGHVINGEGLEAIDIPNISADKITTGEFGTARLEDDAVTMPKLADYSISYIQEAQPSITPDLHIGCLWYQESTAQLRMWNGNSFMPVGFGRLSQENLRFGGTVNADTGNVVNLTDAGRNGGLIVGDPLPAASDALGGLYVVVSEAGDNISVVPSVSFDAGDWCLCVNATEGWIRIDTLSGGGGGGGLLRLNDLLDVDINSPQAGDTLIFDPSTGQWTNRTTTADRVTISPAFDGGTSAFTLSMDVLDQNNILMSVGGVILEPGIDFQIAAGTRNLNFATPPPEGSPYFILNQQTVNASSGGGGGGTSLPPGTTENEYLQWNNTLGSWQPSTELDGGSF